MYCSQILDIHGHIATHFIFIYDYNYWGYVIECDFAVEGHILLKIFLPLRIFF
jgi:hypothetical protein